MKNIFSLSLLIALTVILGGCRDDIFVPSDVQGGEVRFFISIDGSDQGTRGIDEDSKVGFSEGDIVHIKADFICDNHDGNPVYTDTRYGVLKCNGHTYWKPIDGLHSLSWPDNAISASFTAYYIHDTNDALTDGSTPTLLISDIALDEIPMTGSAVDIPYGQGVQLKMKRLLSVITFTELRDEITDRIWFTTTDRDAEGRIALNNALYFDFDEATATITPRFTQVPDPEYKSEKKEESDPDEGLIFIESRMGTTVVEDIEQPSVTFLLEPSVYHTFRLLYPTSRTDYSTYLTYDRDLAKLTEGKGLEPNGRYVFSILKSLGVIVDQAPDDGWDEEEPTVDIDVEQFLRHIHDGTEYWEFDENTQKWVQILEATGTGTRLLQNVDFKYEYYDVFQPDNFRPNLSLLLDGNYHYIYHTACPLFYENYGTITNLGFKESQTKRELISIENSMINGQNLDQSYNGMIVSNNRGTVINIRVVDMDMTVKVKTSAATPTQENHNVALLFGTNNGHIYDIGISGRLSLTVDNAPGEDIMPRVIIGGITAQNLGEINNVNYIDDEGFADPELIVTVRCKGPNGVYKMGGIAGNNTGQLIDIFLPSLRIDATQSEGLESYLGGMVGDNPNSTSGTPLISNCIVRGDVMAGKVAPQLNLNSLSYVGGIAGSMNSQASILESSVSVSVVGASVEVDGVTYAEGGAFGLLNTTEVGQDGTIHTLACYGAKLSGPEYIGNFAGIAPHDWDYYRVNAVTVKNATGKYIGFVRN